MQKVEVFTERLSRRNKVIYRITKIEVNGKDVVEHTVIPPRTGKKQCLIVGTYLEPIDCWQLNQQGVTFPD